jgi:hypothetical protein
VASETPAIFETSAIVIFAISFPACLTPNHPIAKLSENGVSGVYIKDVGRIHPRTKIDDIPDPQPDMGVEGGNQAIILIANMDQFFRARALYHPD